MKKTFLFIIIYSALTFCYAQHRNTFFIRNYRADLSVQFNTDFPDKKEHNIEDYKKEDKVYSKDDKKDDFNDKEDDKSKSTSSFFSLFDGYGSYIKSHLNLDDSYSFQGQQYNPELGLYFFPFRTFSSLEKRFLQVDPKSQYFSPYNFVGSDPINQIDRDGQEARPLVIYEEEHDFQDGLSPMMKDFKAAFPNAHYVPMSDLTNGDVMPLPDWDGNVYINTHAGNYPGEELEVERGNDIYKFKSEEMPEAFSEYGESGYRTMISGEYVGERLRELATNRRVPLKNVFVGGCQGEVAAKKISEGFGGTKNKVTGERATFAGPKEGIYLHYETPSHLQNFGKTPLSSEPKIHFGPIYKEGLHTQFLEEEQTGKSYLKLSEVNAKGRVIGAVPYADKDDIEGFMEGRIAKNLESRISVFEKFY